MVRGKLRRAGVVDEFVVELYNESSVAGGYAIFESADRPPLMTRFAAKCPTRAIEGSWRLE